MSFAGSKEWSSLVVIKFVLAERTNCLLVYVLHCSFHFFLQF